MLTKTLSLECPRGQTGKETISSEGPTKLPEAMRALQKQIQAEQERRVQATKVMDAELDKQVHANLNLKKIANATGKVVVATQTPQTPQTPYTPQSTNDTDSVGGEGGRGGDTTARLPACDVDEKPDLHNAAEA